MKDALLSVLAGPPQGLRLDAPARDPFREQAERRAAKAALKQGHKGEAPLAAASTFYNPFTAQPRAAAMKPVPTRLLSNGAALQLVSSRPTEKAEERTAEKEEKKSRSIFRTVGSAALAIVSAPVEREPPTASATAPPAAGPLELPRPKPADPKPTPVKRSGGGGSGGRYSGGGEDRTFDQDDIAGILVGILLLFLLGWTWLQSLGKSEPKPVDPVAGPQVAKAEPAPLPDPFGPGPVDLRPTSPLPEAAPAPAAPATRALDVPATPPPSATAALPAAAPTDARPLHVYFCTARSSMTPEARTAFDQQIASWKTTFAGQELIVTGYADTRGASAMNAELAANRADYIAGVLREQGLQVTEATGVGELPGLEDSQNCANQRRADISLKSLKAEPSRACAPPQEALPLTCA